MILFEFQALLPDRDVMPIRRLYDVETVIISVAWSVLFGDFSLCRSSMAAAIPIAHCCGIANDSQL
jgi:hypothetical protein